MNSGQCPELYHLHHVQVPALTDKVTDDMCKPSQLATLAQNQLCSCLTALWCVIMKGLPGVQNDLCEY